MEINVYNLKLFEEKDFYVHNNTTNNNYMATFTRVPGGWVFSKKYEDTRIKESIFIPFNNEFFDDYLEGKIK